MSSIHHLSAHQLFQAADLKEEIEALEKQLAQLTGAATKSAAAPVLAKAPKKKGGMSALGRARVAAAQKARWAKIKAAKPAAAAVKETKIFVTVKPVAKVAAAKPAKKKFTMSAAAKAKISAAAKARWAKVKAAKN